MQTKGNIHLHYTTLASCSAASGVQTHLFGAPGIVRSNAYLPGWWHPSRLPPITCARYHVRTTALDTEALALSAHEFGTVCRAAYGHWTSATNILRRCWRHTCFDKATALCDILYKRLRNILTYLLTLHAATILHCVQKKNTHSHFLPSPWVMCRFKQKLQWIYLRNGRFWTCRN